MLRRSRPFACLTLLVAVLLPGCDLLGIETASTVAARRESEGKAIGGGCRHAGRAIEDCYALNRRADKGAVFAGWREMNDYMRENKIAEVPPSVPQAGATAAAGEAEPPAAEASAPAKGTKSARSGKS